MIRLATVEDAEQLFALNEKFNGKGETDLDTLKAALCEHPQEVIVVAEENGALAGFVCVQLKKSFCYRDHMAEITEVFVDEPYRRRKFASRMITFAQKYCLEHYSLHKFELLTGETNAEAQALYASLGYHKENDILLVNRF